MKPSSLIVCVTVATLNPDIETMSPATALGISIWFVPYLLKIFRIFPVSTYFPFKSIAFTLSFNLIDPELILPINIFPK